MAARTVSLSRYIREIRLHLCQTSESSSGVRDFVQAHYVSLKQQNPNLPFLIRECSGVEPKIYGRYDFGREKCIPLSNYSSDQVMKALETLAVDGST